MKSLTILTLLLTVAQTPVPILGKTSNGSTHTSADVATPGQKQQNPAAHAPDENQAPAAKTDRGGQSNEDTQHSVTVTQLPPVTISKVGFDWSAFANYLLVLVGFGGIVVAVCTLFAIKKQADLMSESLKVTQRTLVHTQRPRIVVRNFYFSEVRGVGGCYNTMNGLEKGSFATGQFYIVNTGGTRAIVREIFCKPYNGGEALPMKRPYEGTVGIKQDMQLMAGESNVWTFNRQMPLDTADIQDLDSHAKYFHVLGWIGYTDDLGIYRMTHFCRRFEPMKGRFVAVDNPDYEAAD